MVETIDLYPRRRRSLRTAGLRRHRACPAGRRWRGAREQIDPDERERVGRAIPAEVASENGFFAEEGLDVALDFSNTPNLLVPAFASGDIDVTYAEIGSIANAAKQGFEVVAVSGASRFASGYIGLLAPAGSRITQARDFDASSTVGTPSRGSICDLATLDVLRQAGVPDGVTYVEMAVSALGPALAAGQVDAICLPEPLLTQVRQQMGLQLVVNATEDQWVWRGLPANAFWTSCRFAADNPNTVAAVERAITKASRYAAEHPTEARAILMRNLSLSQEAADAAVLPDYDGALDEQGLGEFLGRAGVDMPASQLLGCRS